MRRRDFLSMAGAAAVWPTAGRAQIAVVQSVASSLRLEASPVNMQDAAEIERAVSGFAGASDAGLIVTASAFANVHRELIIRLANRNKLPAVYFAHYFVAEGGLISYGTDLVDQFPMSTVRRGSDCAEVA